MYQNYPLALISTVQYQIKLQIKYHNPHYIHYVSSLFHLLKKYMKLHII